MYHGSASPWTCRQKNATMTHSYSQAIVMLCIIRTEAQSYELISINFGYIQLSWIFEMQPTKIYISPELEDDIKTILLNEHMYTFFLC